MTDQLTPSESQFLVRLLKSVLREGEEVQHAFKVAIEESWQLCDREKPETAGEFKYLNNLKDNYRIHRSQLKKLQRIQNKLKKIV